MSLGSAASLAGRVPQAPLSPARTGLSVRPFPVFPQSSGASPPPRRLPLQAGEEPPRGRILVVEKDVSAALALQKLLRDLGYRVIGPAGSALEASQLMERTPVQWPIDCALLSARLEDAAHVAYTLRGRGIPIAWVVPRGASTPVIPATADEPVLRMPIDRDTLFSTVDRVLGRFGRSSSYPKPPPQEAWPRIFPQL
jgi:CheY-like chemotaxis protein